MGTNIYCALHRLWRGVQDVLHSEKVRLGVYENQNHQIDCHYHGNGINVSLAMLLRVHIHIPNIQNSSEMDIHRTDEVGALYCLQMTWW